MHARVSVLEGPAEKIDEGVRVAKTEVLPAVGQEPGFKGIIFLGDRESGKTIAVTFWEDEKTMRESEEHANQLRQQAADAEEASIKSVERFEVLVSEMT
jgi:heme-degrading monooxygenase HmoA